MTHTDFEYRKATQELNYFAKLEGGRINKMKALKLIYLANRYHFRKYGRLISKDTFYAMENGPVPSGTRDILQGTFVSEEEINSYCNEYIASSSNLEFESIQDVDMKLFSESDKEALEFAWGKFGHLGKYILRDITHNYPDWKKHKETLKHRRRVLMDINDFLNDPSDDTDKCFELCEEDKTVLRQYLDEVAEVESIWT